MTSAPAPRAALLAALDVVRGRLAATTLPLECTGAEQARERRAALLDQLDDYLLPRLRSDGAPLLVVVGGSTGAGKSTLVNSVLGAPLTRPGVLRPTTRSPVLVHHPADEPWFTGDRVLPSLTRVRTTSGTPSDPTSTAPAESAETVRALRLAAYPGLPAGLALLDAPDLDSLETANRELAAQLLAAADLWLFVTTAARYADAVPWEALRAAAGRRAQVALVLDRVDPGTEEVAVDLRRLMAAHGLADAPLFLVPEAPLDADGMLPEAAVAEVSGWLSDLGGDALARDEVATATRDGVIDELAGTLGELADAVAEQVRAEQRLREAVTSSYDEAAAAVRAATRDGEMLRGEVLARWQDFVGASGVMRAVERGVGRFRDAVGSFFRGERVGPETVEVAIAQGLAAVTLDAVETARERTRALWRSDPAGVALVAGTSGSVAGGSTADLRAVIAQQIRGWQGDVLDVVREQGEDRRGLARALSFGVNGLGLAVMVVVFASTAGIPTGAEVGIAGGTAVLAQKVLEAAFGDDAVRRLTAIASARLGQRLQSVLDADEALATSRLAALRISGDDEQALRSAADAVVAAAALEREDRTWSTTRRVDPLAPQLRGAHLRGRVTASGASATLSPYEQAAAGEGDRSTSDGAHTATDPHEPPARRGFWRRVFGRGEDA